MTLDALHTEVAKQIASGTGVKILAALDAVSMSASAAVATSLKTQMSVASDMNVTAGVATDIVGTSFSLSGTGDVIGLTGAKVDVTFTTSTNLWPDIQIIVTLPDTWSLGKSFASLAGTPPDKLTLWQPLYIFTTADGTKYQWADSTGGAQTTALSVGLNFVADLQPSDVIQLLSVVLEPGTGTFHIPLSGTFDLTPLGAGKPSPDVDIHGEISLKLLPTSDVDAWFALGAPSLVIANDPTATMGPTMYPRVLLSLPVMSKGAELVDITAPIGGISKGLSLAVTGANGGLTLEQITTLFAGESINSDLPSWLGSIFDTVAFESFSIDLSTPSMKPSCMSVAVGTIKPWGLSEFQVESTRLAFNYIDPLGAKLLYRTFDAQVSIFPEIFKDGEFDLLVENDPDQTIISAEYTGTVTLKDLISGLSAGKITPPDDLEKVTFSDFGFSFTKTDADWDWQLFGKADATFQVPLVSTPFDIELMANITTIGGKRAYQLVGALAVGNAHFSLELDVDATDTVLKGEWTSPGDPLEFADLVKAFGFTDLPDIPTSLKLALVEASFTYDFTQKLLILTAKSLHYGSAVFVADTLADGTAFYGFGIDVPLGITLADIPLVGDKIPEADTLGIDNAGIWILSTALKKADVEQINGHIDAANFPTLPDQDISDSVLMHAALKLGPTQTTQINLAMGAQKAADTQPALAGSNPTTTAPANTALAAAPATPAPADAKGDGTTWISIQQQFGVFQFNRIGIAYQDNTLKFVLDAGMDFGPLIISFDGLTIGSPLTEFVPKFDIQGLGLAYNKPPLEIEGALLKLPSSELAAGTAFQFDGYAVVKATDLSLSAIGSYAQMTASDPSLFIYAQLETPLGGPPAFFVTGLMAGFGFNRSLKVPAQNEVSGFPLLALAQPPAPGQPAKTQSATHVLDVLEGREPIIAGGTTQQWIAPSPGDYWLAVGLEFSSFELVQSKAMLIVEFGHDLVFTLLGLSTLQLPQPSESDETYAFVELQLKAVFMPNDGFFGLSAVLSNNSYVLTPDCKLTGGFAFYLWFGDNEHSGQFVITLGGYHPAFKPPSYFPAEPRLGFNWAVSSDVTIKGEAYFALTPSCVMAGGALEAMYHSGDLKAWFTAHMDVLVSWKPFFYTASIGVSLGASYRLNLLFCHKTISVSIGASVEIWGPPTGGKVKVHLVVVSFTVHFGSSSASANNTPLGWTDFVDLLPHPNEVCKITVSDGLSKSLATTTGSEKKWVVRAQNFRFFTQSAIPASSLRYGAPAPAGAAALQAAGDPASNFDTTAIDIKPMNKTGVASTHNLQIFHETSTTPINVDDWTLSPRTNNSPESLWGKPSAPFTQIPATPSATLMNQQYVGYDVQAPDPQIGASLGVVPLTALAHEYLVPEGKSPVDGATSPSPAYVPSFDQTSVSQISAISGAPATTSRGALFDVVSKSSLIDGTNEAMTAFGTNIDTLFSDPPMVQN